MDKVHCPYCMGKDFMVPGSMDETPCAPVAGKTRFFNRLTTESDGTSLASKIASGDLHFRALGFPASVHVV